MRIFCIALALAAVAPAGSFPNEARAAQIDLTPPLKPAKPSPKPVAPPGVQPLPRPALPAGERITASDAQKRIFDLQRRVEACATDAEIVRRADTMPELENGVCLEKSFGMFKTLTETARKVARQCPQLKDFQDLRSEIDLAVSELERKRRRTSAPEAQEIYVRKIKALRADDAIFNATEKRLTEIRNDIDGKIATVQEVIQACQEVPQRSDSPADPHPDLLAAAKKEGVLATVALPRDWCGFGRLMDDFQQKYGLRIVSLDPGANSKQQVEAIRASGNNDGGPDVVDLSYFYGQTAAAAGLLQPYKVARWNSIPSGAKDVEGYWYADYFGVIAFEVNTRVVAEPPFDWPDLLRPEYKGAIALVGEPHETNEALQAIFAAGLSASDGRPGSVGDAGLKFFANLNGAANLVRTGGSAKTLADGTTPILIRWDYMALADRDRLGGNPPVAVVVPRTGVVATAYVQAISAHAPHPNAARLWMEHLYSDEGQLEFLKAYCRPARYRDLVDSGLVPADLAARLPPASAYDNAVFPDPVEQAKARATIVDGWRQVFQAGGG